MTCRVYFLIGLLSDTKDRGSTFLDTDSVVKQQTVRRYILDIFRAVSVPQIQARLATHIYE
jgi:hypothetical protein